MPDTQISEKMVDAFIAAFNSGVFDKAPFGMPIDERCDCEQCVQEEAEARKTARAALEAALSGHVVVPRGVLSNAKDALEQTDDWHVAGSDNWTLYHQIDVLLNPQAAGLPAPPVPEIEG